MIKNRYLDGYDEDLNYKDKAVWAAEQQRERDFYATYPLRWLYVQWDTPYMRLVAGQKGSDWGLGMLANGGDG